MTSIFEDEEKGHISVMPSGFGPMISEKKKKLTVVHGRFQPFHNGHKEFIEKAVTDGDATLVIVCSAGESPSQQNPLEWHERVAILEEVFGDGIITATLNDYKYDDDTWYKEAIEIMKDYAGEEYDIVLKGAIKPGDTATEECYKGFEERGINVEYIEISNVINATDIRNKLFCGFVNWSEIKDVVPIATYEYLLCWTSSMKSPMKEIEAEWKAVRDYKKSWEGSPFPPVFIAVDGLCVWYDNWNKPHILLVERKGPIGKGKWAMPGGYMEHDQTLLKSVWLELDQETGLNPDGWNLKCVDVFDSPNRSARGRMVTHVHNFVKRSKNKPWVNPEGGDDAQKAWLCPVDEIAPNRHKFFADHFHIIRIMFPEVDEY